MLLHETTGIKAIHAVTVCVPRVCIPVLVSSCFNPMYQECFAMDKLNQLSVAHENFLLTVKEWPDSRSSPAVPRPVHDQASVHSSSQLWIVFNLKFKHWSLATINCSALLEEQK